MASKNNKKEKEQKEQDSGTLKRLVFVTGSLRRQKKKVVWFGYEMNDSLQQNFAQIKRKIQRFL